MKIIEAYHCDYCKKYSKSKGVITRHEKECYHNPVTRACATCKHLRHEEYKRQHVGFETTCSRPICVHELEISTLTRDEINEPIHRINLANHCPLWQLREESEDE